MVTKLSKQLFLWMDSVTALLFAETLVTLLCTAGNLPIHTARGFISQSTTLVQPPPPQNQLCLWLNTQLLTADKENLPHFQMRLNVFREVSWKIYASSYIVFHSCTHFSQSCIYLFVTVGILFTSFFPAYFSFARPT